MSVQTDPPDDRPQPGGPVREAVITGGLVIGAIGATAGVLGTAWWLRRRARIALQRQLDRRWYRRG